MNNEPVAWARQDGVIAFHKKPEVDSQGFKWFPLYTHPVKELDENFDAICLENKRLQAEIDSLKDKLMLAKQSLEIVEGWIKK